MTKVKNFSENLEKGLVRLGHDVARQKESPEKTDLPEREIIKESLRSIARTEANPPVEGIPAPSASVSAPTSAPSEDFLPNYLAPGDSEGIKKSLERLLQIAAKEDIVKAVNEAKKYPPFVEDAFHDALIDKFLPELKKRGIIK
ncbi:MAG: hypothetical protein AAB399_00705 [Patescibacteria group bacterium]